MTHSTRSASTIDHGPRTAAPSPTTLRAVQVLAVLSVLNLVCQYVTAGQLFPRGGPLGLHATGAIVLHVVTGLLTVAALLQARVDRGPWWPAVVAAVVFVLSFVQAYYGEHTNLAVHVPGALVLTFGIVWVTAWSFTRGVRR
jgi:O-antigen/teichoic acid export membrane protein